MQLYAKFRLFILYYNEFSGHFRSKMATFSKFNIWLLRVKMLCKLVMYKSLINFRLQISNFP